MEGHAEVVDLIDIWANARIVKVSGNEGDAGVAQIKGPLSLLLRAERDGQGSGRVYTLELGGHRWGARGS